MFKIRYLLGFLGALFSLTACGVGKSPLPNPSPMPYPGASWSVQLSQSGGIAASNLSVEVSSSGKLIAEDQRSGRSVTQTLPPEEIAQIRKLVASIKVPASTPPLSACADCFIYDLHVQSAAGDVKIHADDVTLKNSGGAALIVFLSKIRDNALAAQP